jgi:Domain of unknown function (DUF3473)/FHA domain
MNELALKSFRNACGLRHPITLEYADAGDPSAGADHALLECPFALIGRDSGSDLVLDHSQISRRHAFLQAVAGRIFVVDLHSRTKVFWEREETPRSQGWLDWDHFIQIGPYRIRRAGENAGDEAVGRRNEILEIPPATLRFVGANIPVGGGGYFRLLPLPLMKLALALSRRDPRSGAVTRYFHPREFDADQPRLPLRRMNHFRTYVGIRHNKKRLLPAVIRLPVHACGRPFPAASPAP